MYITFEEFKKMCRYSRHWIGAPADMACTMDATNDEIICNEENCPIAKADQVLKDDKKKYLIQYECCNCKTRFVKSILMGQRAEGRGDKCPYCGADERLNYEIDWFHKVIGAYTPGEENRYGEILP